MKTKQRKLGRFFFYFVLFFQEVMKGVQMMYDITKFRRPSNTFGGVVPDGQSGYPPTSPSTPALSVYTIDDEFNLPVSVAFVVLVVYIVFGAIVFCFEEGWGFFESFYFVFISMSTIGFGDFVPKVWRSLPFSMHVVHPLWPANVHRHQPTFLHVTNCLSRIITEKIGKSLSFDSEIRQSLSFFVPAFLSHSRLSRNTVKSRSLKANVI